MGRTDEDDDVLGALARDRWAALCGYAYLLTGDTREAEDLVQDAFVKTFARSRPVDATTAEGYVRRAVLSTYIDGYRRRRRWAGLVHLVAREDRVESPAARIGEEQDVQAALRGLPPQQRACVVLRFFDDLPVDEIAARMGLHPGTVKRYLSLAMTRLEGALGPVDDAAAHGTEDVGVVVEKGRRR